MKKSNPQSAIYERMIKNVLLTETIKSDNQEAAAKKAIKELLDVIKITPEFLPLGKNAPYDILLKIGDEQFKLEVKEEKQGTLAKLGSAKAMPVIIDDYISSVQKLAISITKYYNLGPDSSSTVTEWWTSISGKGNYPRYSALSSYEISESLFADITNNYNTFKEKGLMPILADLRGGETSDVSKSPGRQVRVNGEDFIVDDDTLERIMRAISSGGKTQRNANTVERRKQNLLQDLQNVMFFGDRIQNLSGGVGAWSAYKRLLGKTASSYQGVKGIIGVNELEPYDRIMFYLPTQLTSDRMTQGGRLPLKPTSAGISLTNKDEGTAIKFLTAIGADQALQTLKNAPAIPENLKILKKMIHEVIKSR